MHASTMRWQKLLILVGFLIVGSSELVIFLYYSSTGALEASRIATAVGFWALAWASWTWLSVLERSNLTGSGMGRVLRLFSLASLILGAAYLGELYQLIQDHRHHTLNLRGEAIYVLLSLLGFGSISIGFWIAGRVVNRESQVQAREMDLTAR